MKSSNFVVFLKFASKVLIPVKLILNFLLGYKSAAVSQLRIRPSGISTIDNVPAA